jgi:anthranilate phosphoribosyltransferase
MKRWIEKVGQREVLSPEDVNAVVEGLLSATYSDVEKADFLDALHVRGESPEEIVAFASAFMKRAEPFVVADGLGPVLDVCGTGGDKLGLFNVSTAVMFVAAGAGARLVKHGNRGITSRSGGADVLEALGISPDSPQDRLQQMIEEAGAVFLFAPRFHPAFKSVVAARKILGERKRASIFNMLGPLLNPARPAYQLAGVFSESLVALYASVLPSLGRERSWVVHGQAGEGRVMDEISTLGPTVIAEVIAGATSSTTLHPSDLGVPAGRLDELLGGDAAENATILQRILAGDHRGAARDLVVINAAAALQVAALALDWEEAMARANESIDSGAARRVLEKMRHASQAS